MSPQKSLRHILASTFIVLFLVGCVPAATSTPAVSIATPAIIPSKVPKPTAEVLATPAFDVQKLEGIWVAQGHLYIRQNATGNYTVVENSIQNFLGRSLEGTATVVGDTIQLSGEEGCGKAQVGIYRVQFSATGDSYTLTLVMDPCQYRKGGDVPAANTYHKLETLVQPGSYTTKVTQAEAQAAGGENLSKYIGAWELQLSSGNTYTLLHNSQSVAQGEYFSAGEQFALQDGDICDGSSGLVLKTTVDAKGITFTQDPSWTSGYKCKDMLLILTGHPWAKK